MRASDLLGAAVVGKDGRPLGKVLDVRLVQDGPMLGVWHALRIDGLVVGTRSLTARLGYDRRKEHGPLLVRWLALRLMARNGYLRWDQVSEWSPGEVRTDADRLPPMPLLS